MLPASTGQSRGDFTLKKCLNQENNSTEDGEVAAQLERGGAGDRSLEPDGISG